MPMQSTAQGTKVTVLADGITTSDGYRKSKRSNSQGACVEMNLGAEPRMRDTTHRDLGHLGFTPGAWARTLPAL